MDVDVSTALTHPRSAAASMPRRLALWAHYAPGIIRFHPGPSKRAGVAARPGRHGGSAAFGVDIKVGAVRSRRGTPPGKARVAGDRTDVAARSAVTPGPFRRGGARRPRRWRRTASAPASRTRQLRALLVYMRPFSWQKTRFVSCQAGRAASRSAAWRFLWAWRAVTARLGSSSERLDWGCLDLAGAAGWAPDVDDRVVATGQQSEASSI